jgi:hypothetical protein
MKLYFSKDSSNEIVVKMSISTVVEEFSYVEMIKNLLLDNNFDETDFSAEITADEKGRIETMLSSINESVEEEEEGEGEGDIF